MINISQIFITDNSEEPLPILFEEASNTVKSNLIHDEYHIYRKEEIEDFLKDNFPEEVLKSFLKLKPYALKKDLANYCLGYIKGGWFVDISIKITLNLNLKVFNKLEFLGFRDYGPGVLKPNTLNYQLQTSLFYTQPKSKIMEKAIEISIKNCKEEFYGLTTSCITGPSVLGRSQSFFGTNHDQIIGFFMPLTEQFPQKNRSYILPTGNIFALHKDTWLNKAQGGDLTAFGAKGTNNHIDMYYNKEVFDTGISI